MQYKKELVPSRQFICQNQNKYYDINVVAYPDLLPLQTGNCHANLHDVFSSWCIICCQKFWSVCFRMSAVSSGLCKQSYDIKIHERIRKNTMKYIKKMKEFLSWYMCVYMHIYVLYIKGLWVVLR